MIFLEWYGATCSTCKKLTGYFFLFKEMLNINKLEKTDFQYILNVMVCKCDMFTCISLWFFFLFHRTAWQNSNFWVPSAKCNSFSKARKHGLLRDYASWNTDSQLCRTLWLKLSQTHKLVKRIRSFFRGWGRDLVQVELINQNEIIG